MPKIATQNSDKLSASVTVIPGVGSAVAQKLAKLHIHSIQDLLFHLPIRYQDRTQLTAMHALAPDDYAVIEGEVAKVEVMNRRARILQVTLTDHTGYLAIRFFHFNTALQKRFQLGTTLRFFGQVKGFRGELYMTHPEWINPQTTSNQHMKERLTPIYSTTEGITQKLWWQIIEFALNLLKQDQNLTDFLPQTWRSQFHLPHLVDALEIAHRPMPDEDVNALMAGNHPAQQRLACEELLAHHLSLQLLRHKTHEHHAPILNISNELIAKFIAQLPFSLTRAQQRVYQEIAQDLAKNIPMMRLVQGDVGSGKTVVAALTALQALEQHYQVALMAPTEILAEQHYQKFHEWLTPLGIHVIWLTSKQTAKQKREALEQLKLYDNTIAIGTHALFQEQVEFKKLGVVIIDEQHRFGVHQRLALRNKGLTAHNEVPHQLIMTATPIPRTLAMTAYADLDHSIIDELPKGRKPIQTLVLSGNKREEMITRIQHACHDEGAQVYWVCPLIEESEVLQCQAAEACYAELQQKLPHCRIGLIHGRLKAAEKETIMQAFKNQQLDVLVATTVIEVGVDVPNANLMVIENSERLGLAQLHQLRGRVGRGARQSYCILLFQYPLSEIAAQRLAIMRETNDGFAIAQRDLELRGPGEVLGTRQTGILEFRVANLMRDQIWIERIHDLAKNWLDHNNPIIDQIIQRWLKQKNLYGYV